MTVNMNLLMWNHLGFTWRHTMKLWSILYYIKSKAISAWIMVLLLMSKGFDMWYASDKKLCQCYGSYSNFLFPIRHRIMHTYSQSKQIRCTNKCKDKTQIVETRTYIGCYGGSKSVGSRPLGDRQTGSFWAILLPLDSCNTQYCQYIWLCDAGSPVLNLLKSKCVTNFTNQVFQVPLFPQIDHRPHLRLLGSHFVRPLWSKSFRGSI